MSSKKAKNKLAKSKLNAKQIMKRKVRASAKWSELREQIRVDQMVDPISLKPLNRSYNLHHLSQDDNFYNDLSPERFCGVNDYSHRTIHYLYDIVIREGDFEVLNRLKLIIERMIKITEADKQRGEINED